MSEQPVGRAAVATVELRVRVFPIGVPGKVMITVEQVAGAALPLSPQEVARTLRSAADGVLERADPPTT